jgi:hypothetical protein
MELGDVAALLIGIAMLILPAWLATHLVRRQRRLATWTRTQATIRHTRKTKYDSSATTTSAATETAVRTRYGYRDTTGVPHVGEVEHLHDPKVGDVVEIMYDPDDPSSSDTVYGGSVVGRIINYGAAFILLGGGGVFLILASLGLISA